MDKKTLLLIVNSLRNERKRIVLKLRISEIPFSEEKISQINYIVNYFTFSLELKNLDLYLYLYNILYPTTDYSALICWFADVIDFEKFPLFFNSLTLKELHKAINGIKENQELRYSLVIKNLEYLNIWCVYWETSEFSAYFKNDDSYS